MGKVSSKAEMENQEEGRPVTQGLTNDPGLAFTCLGLRLFNSSG